MKEFWRLFWPVCLICMSLALLGGKIAEHYGYGRKVVGYGENSDLLPEVEPFKVQSAKVAQMQPAIVLWKAEPPASLPVQVVPRAPEAVDRTESQEIVASKGVEVAGKSWRVIRTVQVRPGWWVALYVRKTRGASLELTLLCNGWQAGSSPVIQPGQTLKICGKARKRRERKPQTRRIGAKKRRDSAPELRRDPGIVL